MMTEEIIFASDDLLRVNNDQKEQAKRLAENAIERAIIELGLDEDSFQRVLDAGHEFQSAIFTSIKKHSISKQYVNEEVESNYGYPKGYVVASIQEQIDTLHKHFPNLRLGGTVQFVRKMLPSLRLPIGIDWFAVPRWDEIANTYNEAVEKILEVLGRTRAFKNWRKGKLGPDCLQQMQRHINLMEKIKDRQQGDILIFPAQFGILHRGCSARRAREALAHNEFGLGVFHVGCMILTHPSRLQGGEELDIDCLGDEYSLKKASGFSNVPVFYSRNKKINFDVVYLRRVYGYTGAATGYVM